MNDPIKLLVAGAVIALAGVAAGGVIVGWTLQMESVGKSVPVSALKPLQIASTPNNPALRSILPSTNVPQVRFPTQSIMPAGSINPANGRPQPMIPPAFQKVQDVPEVKAAREALAEAQKKYFTLVQAAMAKADPQFGVKIAPVTIQQ